MSAARAFSSPAGLRRADLDAHLGPELRRLAAAGLERQLACQHLEGAGKADGGNDGTFDRFGLSP